MQLDVGNEPYLSKHAHLGDAFLILWYSSQLRVPIKALYCGRVSDSYLQYFLSYEFLSSDRQTDGRTESDAYEPTVQYAQVSSKIKKSCLTYRDDEPDLKQLFYVYDTHNMTEHQLQLRMDQVKQMEKQQNCKPFLNTFQNESISNL